MWQDRITVEVGYPRHPKTITLIQRLGNGADAIPVRLWCWAAEFKPQHGKLGNLDMDPSEVESLVDWWGEPGACFNAMLGLFIDRNEDGFYLHDWGGHRGHVTTYHERAKVAANTRWARHKAMKAAKEERAAAGRKASQPAIDLVDRLVGLMLKNDPNARVPGKPAAWQQDAEKLLTTDGRGAKEATAVLEWCQRSTFWRSNILSMGKFRAKYSQLLLRMQDEGKESVNGPVGSAAPVAGKYAK